MTRIAMTLWVLDLTDSGVTLGLLSIVQYGPVLLFSAYAGVIVDRTNKRLLLVGISLVAMLQSLTLATVALFGTPHLALLFGVATIGGIATSIDNPLRRSIVVEIVPPDEMGNAVSLNTALMTLARVIGPAVGGLLVATLGLAWTFLVDAISYVGVLSALLLMDKRSIYAAPVARSRRGQVREGFRYAARVDELRTLMILLAVLGVFAFNTETVMPLFVSRDLAGVGVSYPAVMSVMGIGSLAGALAAARRTVLNVALVVRSCLVLAVAFAVLTVSNSLWTVLLGCFAFGFSSTLLVTAATAILQIRVEPNMRGRISAIQSLVLIGSVPIGGPIAGTISQHLGARYALAMAAVAVVCAAVLGALAPRRAAARAHERTTACAPPQALNATEGKA